MLELPFISTDPSPPIEKNSQVYSEYCDELETNQQGLFQIEDEMYQNKHYSQCFSTQESYEQNYENTNSYTSNEFPARMDVFQYTHFISSTNDHINQYPSGGIVEGSKKNYGFVKTNKLSNFSTSSRDSQSWVNSGDLVENGIDSLESGSGIYMKCLESDQDHYDESSSQFFESEKDSSYSKNNQFYKLEQSLKQQKNSKSPIIKNIAQMMSEIIDIFEVQMLLKSFLSEGDIEIKGNLFDRNIIYKTPQNIIPSYKDQYLSKGNVFTFDGAFKLRVNQVNSSYHNDDEMNILLSWMINEQIKQDKLNKGNSFSNIIGVSEEIQDFIQNIKQSCRFEFNPEQRIGYSLNENEQNRKLIFNKIREFNKFYARSFLDYLQPFVLIEVSALKQSENSFMVMIFAENQSEIQNQKKESQEMNKKQNWKAQIDIKDLLTNQAVLKTRVRKQHIQSEILFKQFQQIFQLFFFYFFQTIE